MLCNWKIKRFGFIAGLFLVVSLILAACGSPPVPTPTQTPTVRPSRPLRQCRRNLKLQTNLKTSSSGEKRSSKKPLAVLDVPSVTGPKTRGSLTSGLTSAGNRWPLSLMP